MRIDPASAEPGMIAGAVDFSGMRVLEVGSGDGRMTAMISKQAKTVLSIDTDEDAISGALKRAEKYGLHNVEYRVEDVCTIDLKPGEFDSAFLTLSL
jgi:protein-L-isoaspartate O-methyltransferase